MELQVDVDEADVGKVKVGQTASFSVDAFPDRKFPATIRDVRFASETIQGVVTYKAVLTIDNSELLLAAGHDGDGRDPSSPRSRTRCSCRMRRLRYHAARQRHRRRAKLPAAAAAGPAAVPAAEPTREETGANRTVWVLRDGEPTPVKVVIGAERRQAHGDRERRPQGRAEP